MDRVERKDETIPLADEHQEHSVEVAIPAARGQDRAEDAHGEGPPGAQSRAGNPARPLLLHQDPIELISRATKLIPFFAHGVQNGDRPSVRPDQE